MTTTAPTPDTSPAGPRSADDVPDRAGERPFLRVAAGIALLAFPVVLTAGIVTSPPQASDSKQDYVASLGADPALTALSAGLLHYSWVLFALGVLATIGLVRGRRGRVAVPLVAVVTSFSAIQLSGMLLGDWHAAALARALPLEQATAIFGAFDADPWLVVWLQSGRFVGFAGVFLVTLALARAGVLSWWLAALPLVAFAGFFVPVVGVVLGMLVGASPMAVIGVRLLQRSSARVRHQEAVAA